MTDWPVVPIRDLCSSIIDCVNKTAPIVDGPTPYRMIRTTNVRYGRVDLSKVRYVCQGTYERWVRRGKPEIGDIILTREAPLGEVGIITDAAGVFLGQRLVMYRVAPDRADRYFVFGAMRAADVQAQIRAFGSGATVEHMRVPDCGELLVACPDLETQRRIGAVLSAFDRLIEINERRIELLEDLARSLYREWFVRLRAPSVDSGPGEIPSGWEMTDLGSIASWYSGGTPSTANDAYWDGGIPWITSGCLRTVLLTESDRTLTSAGVAAGSRVVDRDAVLFVVRGMSLIREVRAGIAERSLAFGQDCKALVAIDGVEPLFLAFTVLDRQTTMQGMVELAGHGTGKLSTDRIKALPVALPPLAVQQKFVNAVTPIRAGIAAAMEAARSLAHTRDLLLPRLVTGRLDIAEIDLCGLVEREEAG